MKPWVAIPNVLPDAKRVRSPRLLLNLVVIAIPIFRISYESALFKTFVEFEAGVKMANH